MNRRVKKALAIGNDIVFLYNGWQVVEKREWETNGEGPEDDKWEPRRRFVHGGIYVDEVLTRHKTGRYLCGQQEGRGFEGV